MIMEGFSVQGLFLSHRTFLCWQSTHAKTRGGMATWQDLARDKVRAEPWMWMWMWMNEKRVTVLQRMTDVMQMDVWMSGCLEDLAWKCSGVSQL